MRNGGIKEYHMSKLGRGLHEAAIFKVTRHRDNLRSLLKMQIVSSTDAAIPTLLVWGRPRTLRFNKTQGEF